MIYGQGVKCGECGFTAHHKCKGQVPPACGLDTQEKRGRIHLGYYTQKFNEKKWRLNIEGEIFELMVSSVI